MSYSSDLATRLRQASDPSACEDVHNLLIQAADRIEYLEYAAALAGAVSPPPPESAEAYAEVIRKATDKASEQIEKVRRDG